MTTSKYLKDKQGLKEFKVFGQGLGLIVGAVLISVLQ
jgi:hypothetical protein